MLPWCSFTRAPTIGPIDPAYDTSGLNKRKVSLDATTNEVLIYKFDASYQFALSEVEFYSNDCHGGKCPSYNTQDNTRIYRHAEFVCHCLVMKDFYGLITSLTVGVEVIVG